jgi:3-hydroxyisobutyrate dehydrogenase-like beta-hydroxyacid dehydrogenase
LRSAAGAAPRCFHLAELSIERPDFVIEWLHMDTIGLIGVGLLGSAIAARLSAAGYSVLGYDIIPERRLGAGSAREVARACRTIILSLPTSDVVAQVLGDIELTPGMTIIDTTTGEPETMAAIGAKLAKAGIDYLDATVLGSSRVVRSGAAIVMAGGRRQAFDAAAPLFRTFSSRAFYLGSFGAGARMKLVANLALGLHRAVLAETLSFASACGVSPTDALEVLKAGAAYSRVMDDKGEKMLHHDFSVEARLSQHLKDVRLILAAAGAKNARTPLSLVHRQLLERLEAAGYGNLDNSAIIMAYE